jgi:peptidoglycan/xylan/chitin deacetylase (PgdA/CDA1 family)
MDDPLSQCLAPLRARSNSKSLARMMKRHIRIAASAPMYHLGLWKLRRVFRRAILRKREICFLGLHRVLSDDVLSQSKSLRGLIIRERTFAELLKYLRGSFQILSMAAFLKGSWANTNTLRPVCMLTFDDGWRDNYTTAFPLLAKFDIPATIFLVTNLVENGTRFWVERLIDAWSNFECRRLITQRLGFSAQRRKVEEDGGEEVVEFLKHMSMAERDRLLDTILTDERACQEGVDRNMSWDQVAEMSRNGIEFGGHTVHHPLLTFEDDDTVLRELRVAKSTIEAKLGVRARAFCYPNGDWNDRVRKNVVETGYECAFTTRVGWHVLGDDLFSIRRILIHEGNVVNKRGEFSPSEFNMTLGRGW